MTAVALAAPRLFGPRIQRGAETEARLTTVLVGGETAVSGVEQRQPRSGKREQRR